MNHSACYVLRVVLRGAAAKFIGKANVRPHHINRRRCGHPHLNDAKKYINKYTLRIYTTHFICSTSLYIYYYILVLYKYMMNPFRLTCAYKPKSVTSHIPNVEGVYYIHKYMYFAIYMTMIKAAHRKFHP